MANRIFEEITKKHSTTFYFASLFFPRKIRQDVFILYAFLRTADDLVDEKKDRQLFFKFKREVYESIKGKLKSQDPIISAFTTIYHKYGFDIDYLDSFFKTLELDLQQPFLIKDHQSLDNYIYGVAGVVGLMMAKIMRLPKSSFRAAQEFGEWMQLINIIRDIKEDYQKGRVYIPEKDIQRYGLKDITHYQDENKQKFENLIRFEIAKTMKKIKKLDYEIENIPQPYRRAIKVSRDVYISIADKISKKPLRVWEKRVFISRLKLFFILLKNLF